MDNEIVYKPYKNSNVVTVVMVAIVMAAPTAIFIMGGFCFEFFFSLVITVPICIYVIKDRHHCNKIVVTMNDDGISVAEDDNIIKSYRWSDLPYCYYHPYKGAVRIVLSERERHRDFYAVDNFADLLNKCWHKSYVYYDNAIVLPYEQYIIFYLHFYFSLALTFYC